VISRVAECCFWLNRYIERAEGVARVVTVNRDSVLDADIHDATRWKPVIAVMGEKERFERLVGVKMYDNDEASEDFLTFSEENPSSIRTSLKLARENARMTREVISREMWETVNTWWQWFNSAAAGKEYKRDRAQFYQRIRSMCAEFQGVCQNTMLHEEPFDFMRLGMLIERGNQTARLMDVKYHWLMSGPETDFETPRESAQWVGLLRLCAAVEPFFKRTRSVPTGPTVAEFLFQDGAFPRSLVHCFDGAHEFLQRIDKDTGRTEPSSATRKALKLAETIRRRNVRKMLETGLHEELLRVTAESDAVCLQLYADYFAPAANV
jgi:uncharacterized alpha-E superfamily protein